MKTSTMLLVTLMIFLPTIHAADIEKEMMREEIRLLKERLTEVEQRLEVQGNEMGSGESKDAEAKVSAKSPKPRASSIQFSGNEQLDIDEGKVSFLDRVGSFALIKDAGSAIGLSGNADIVYWYSDKDAKSASQTISDFVVDQVRLAIDLDIHEYVKGFAALQFEDYQDSSFAGAGGTSDTEDDGDLQVDEAYILLGDWEFEEGIYAVFGKQYFPFGNVDESGNFINDTLARQLYETRDTGLTVGHKYAGLDINLFAFNGQADEVNDDGSLESNKLDTWGGGISYTMDEEDMKLKVGFSYISNIFQAQNTAARGGLDILADDEDGALADLAKTENDGKGFGFENPFDEFKSNDSRAYNLYGVVGFGPVWFSAEWVSAFNSLETSDTGGHLRVRPEALTLEGACSVPVGDYEVTLATKYEMNNDQDAAGNDIQDVLGFGVASEIFDNTTLTLNYEHYNLEKTINNGNMDLYLAELSIGF